jgi:ornithine cyclodeaminase/alanine dehydrogenase-like protein (mu-crystallin family)
MSPELVTIQLMDADPEQAILAAQETRYLLERHALLGDRKVDVLVCDEESQLYENEMLVTATFADGLLLREVNRLRDGTFIAAVGADLATKRELPPELYDRAKFVADDLRQCLREGELQYAKNRIRGLDNGAGRIADHRGELANGRVVSAAALLKDPTPFLQRSEPIAIYDSTGFSGQDLAVARVLLEELEGRGDIARQPWNPAGTRSLVELLGCAKDADFVVRSRKDQPVSQAR